MQKNNKRLVFLDFRLNILFYFCGFFKLFDASFRTKNLKFLLGLLIFFKYRYDSASSQLDKGLCIKHLTQRRHEYPARRQRPSTQT